MANGTVVRAISMLTAANGCTNNIALGTAAITYYSSPNSVTLFPGFSSPEGSRFTAYIDPCASTANRSSGNTGTQVLMSDAEKKFFGKVEMKKPDVSNN